MFFYEVDDCSICPFSQDNYRKYGSDYHCNGNPDSLLPCTDMDSYGDYTLEEVVNSINAQIFAAEEYYARLAEKERLKKEENKRKAQLRKAANLRNYDLNSEIKRLRKVICKREGAISSLRSLSSAFSLTNAMFEGRSLDNIKNIDSPQIIEWKEANIRDTKRIEELVELRKQRNKEYNKQKRK